jgi:hypothetical protein
VKNEPERGATFRIELPVQPDGNGRQPVGAEAAEMRRD